MRKIQAAAAMLAAILAVTTPVRAQVTPEQVRQAIQRGADFLKKEQDRTSGSWPDHPGQPGGLTALCVLALLNAGVPVDDPAIQRPLTHLRGLDEPDRTYATALQTMAFCEAEPEKDRLLIRRNVQWLERAQLKSGSQKGSWGYSSDGGRGDNSNAQFALLALHEAELVGVKVSPDTWQMALEHWLRSQLDDGSWNYVEGQPPTGSMTCAGIASLVIASGKIGDGAARIRDGQVQCCGQALDDQPLSRGLQWLGSKFTVTTNPSPLNRDGNLSSNAWLLYYLYGVERVGRLTGQRFLGGHDWYREGAEMLVQQQDKLQGYWRGVGSSESNPLVATSFALLFLSKGRRPVVVSKVQYGDTADWDLHPGGLQNLTRTLEQRWRRKLTWQTIDIRAADTKDRVTDTEDLLESPVLLISGRGPLQLTDEQKQKLKAYIDNGGFILAEACHGNGCDGTAFDRDFRALMEELFPTSPLRLLPPDHPVWYAEQRVDPQYMRPLYGIDACCRTSVVYCAENLSCFWELHRGDRETEFPEAVRDEVEACVRTGQNIVAYATNRQLKDKLERPRVTPPPDDTNRLLRGTLVVAKVTHNGGGDDAPNALANLLRTLEQELAVRVRADRRLLAADDPALFDYPILFMHGRRDFKFTAAQRTALGRHLQRGGFLLADSICANKEFTEAFRREIELLVPNSQWMRIPADHPMLTPAYRGFDLATVTLRDPRARRGSDDPLEAALVQATPVLEGLEIDGRLAVVFSPYDLSCALENQSSLECKGYTTRDAARLGINIVLYALQQ